jgi:hypothetical protein
MFSLSDFCSVLHFKMAGSFLNVITDAHKVLLMLMKSGRRRYTQKKQHDIGRRERRFVGIPYIIRIRRNWNGVRVTYRVSINGREYGAVFCDSCTGCYEIIGYRVFV